MTDYIKTTAFWFASACIIFSFIVVILFRSGFVKKTRNEKGELKKKQTITGIIGILAFLGLIILFLYSYNIEVFAGKHQTLINILFINFIMVMLLTAYDSFIVDILFIGIIRPSFLQIPPEMNLKEMIKHVKRTYIIGWVFIMPIIVISSIIYYLVN